MSVLLRQAVLQRSVLSRQQLKSVPLREQQKRNERLAEHSIKAELFHLADFFTSEAEKLAQRADAAEAHEAAQRRKQLKEGRRTLARRLVSKHY